MCYDLISLFGYLLIHMICFYYFVFLFNQWVNFKSVNLFKNLCLYHHLSLKESCRVLTQHESIRLVKH